jgi:hypothetical protein
VTVPFCGNLPKVAQRDTLPQEKFKIRAGMRHFRIANPVDARHTAA